MGVGIVLAGLLVYIVQLLPQFKARHLPPDCHIGNACIHRLAGYSLREIFFTNLGIGLFYFFIIMQYHILKKNVYQIKLVNIFINSIIAPLLMVYTFFLLGSWEIGFVAALFYAITFNFTITLNYLVQPEHYEMILFLVGSNFVLYGIQKNIFLLCIVGCVVLGLNVLIKIPALLSLWTVWLSGSVFYIQAYPTGWIKMGIMLVCFGAPAVVVILYRFFYRDKLPNTYPYNINVFKNFFLALTHSYIHSNKTFKEYAKVYYIRAFFSYLCQYLFLFFLALFFIKTAEAALVSVLVKGFIMASLVFIFRLNLTYTYSFSLVLSIAAACGFISILRTKNEILYIFLFLSVVLSFVFQGRNYFLFKVKEHPVKSSIDAIVSYLKEHLNTSETFMANCGNYSTVLHIMVGKVLDTSLPHVPFNIRKKGQDWYCEAYSLVARKLVQAFALKPPKYIACGSVPVINVKYLEEITGCSYVPEKWFGEYLLYRRQDSYTIVSPGDIPFDCMALFDTDEEKSRYFTEKNNLV